MRARVSALLALAALGASEALRLLLALPSEQAAQLSKGLRRTIADLQGADEGMNATAILVPDGAGGAMDALCEAVRDFDPHLLLSFLPRRRNFFAAMVAGQAGVPILSLTRDYTDMASKGMSELFLSLDPDPEDLADALFHFLSSQDWFQATMLLDDSTFSGAVSRRLLSLSTGPPLLKVLKLPDSRPRLLMALSSAQASRRRVLLLCCSRAREVLQEARQLGMLRGDWVWVLLERATLEPDSFPAGILGMRLRRQITNRHSIRAAVEVASEGVKYLDAQLWLLEQDNRSRASCWDDPSQSRRRLSDALYTMIRRQVERESPVSREGLEPASFEILNLASGGKRRWRRLGNVTGPRVAMDAVVWLRAAPQSVPTPRRALSRPSGTEGRPRFRVVTALSPPFVQPGSRVWNGSCLSGLPCLQLATADRDRVVAIFSEYAAGRAEGELYNVSCCAGISMALLSALARDLGFDFDLYLVADGRFGAARGPRLDGVTADLASGAAHLALAAYSATAARQRVIDFTVPYFHSGVSCLTSSQYREVPLSAFLVPFSIQLWVAVFFGLTATAVAAAVYEWLSPFGLNPWGRQRSKNFSLASALWVMWSLLFSHLVAFKAPKSWPNKVLINVWGCFSVIFLASYTANIAALFAGLFFHLRVHDFHDASLLTLKTGTARGSAAEGYVYAENPELWQHIQRYGVDTLEQGLQQLRNKELDVLIGDTAVLNYFRGNDPGCSLHLLGDSIFEDAYAVGVQKGFPLTDALSAQLLAYGEHGFVDQLQQRWFGRAPCFDERLHRFHQPEPLSVAAVLGVFLLLAAGVGAGAAILVGEHLVFRYALPVLRRQPPEAFWRSPNLMFFSQKLYRFINTVELVSPHHSAKEIVSNLREGQFASLFQKSVKKKFKEEARRRKSKSQFFDMIQEIRRVVRQQNEPKPPSWEDSCQRLTSPPSGTVRWAADEDDDDDESSGGFGSFQGRQTEMGRTLAVMHRFSSKESAVHDSLVESYSSHTSTATFERHRYGARLSASASDLCTVQRRVVRPRVRSLDDLRSLSRDLDVQEDRTDCSTELGDSTTWRSSCVLDDLRLMSLSKEDIVRLWQGSERALLNRLQDTLREKRLLEQKLAFLQNTLLQPSS